MCTTYIKEMSLLEKWLQWKAACVLMILNDLILNGAFVS